MNLPYDSVISLNDDLRVGPIVNLRQPEARSARQSWFTSNLPCQENAEYLCSNVNLDIEKIQSIKKIPEIFIWCGRTTYDKLAAARLVFELQDSYLELKIMDIPDIKIKSKYGRDYTPECLPIMNPEEVHLITRYFRNVDEKEHAQKIKTWTRLTTDNGLFRALQNTGIIESKEVTYFDDILLSKCTENFTPAARIVGESLVDINFEASDSILNWRLIHLAKSKTLEFEGELNCLREYRIKRATTKPKLH